MTKKYWVYICVLLVIFLTITGCTQGEQESEEVLNWKIGIADPEDYFMTQLTSKWAKMIEEKSDGRIKSEVYHSCQLGSDVDMLQGLEIGTVQVWEGGSTVISAVHPLFETWCMPYIYESNEHKYRFWDNNLESISEELAQETDYRIVAVIDGPNRQLTTIESKPIYDIEDLSGLKLRVPEAKPFITLWRALGAAPIAMAFAEVPTSIQTGVVEGQENDVVLTYTSGFFDLCKNLILTNHQAYEGFIVIHEDYYQTIPDDLKEIIQECSEQIMKESREVVGELEEEYLYKAENEKGVNVIRPDLEEFMEKARDAYDEYPHVQPIIDLINSFK
jgi:TRAP-type C4-dicarboxylate transport system substrate-binding protein